jgi:hypothetical protein
LDPQLAQIIDLLQLVLPISAIIVAIGVGGSLLNNWLRIRNGYPLETSWGRPIHPNVTTEDKERIKLLSSENAELRAAISSLRDRLETVERIITDEPYRLEREISGLTRDKGGHA